VAVVLVVAGTVVTVVATSRKPPAPIPSGSTSSSLHADADSPYGEPVTIPLAEGPATGIAVDTKQNLYIAELVQVVQLPAGATTATPLPIAPGLQAFQGDVACAIAVDRAGQVYITGVGDTVARLATPTSPQTILPFTGLKITFGVAVNTSGDVYVADHGRVAILRAATNAQEAVPFHNLSPRGIAVDTAGNIYLYQESVSSAGVVVKLTAGSSKQEALPFQHLESPAGIAVDTKGNVYVSDDRTNKVVKLDAQTYKQTELPFGQLKQPGPLAVDDQGDVYVGDHGNQGITSSRIVKLPAR
jgi:streptogramin lyase